MKINENTAISTPRVLLVPYERRHVPTYHAWMEDETIRAATASERLTLDEEYANQVEWRTAADKLTFIVCLPLPATHGAGAVVGGVDDAPGRMVGDINFFLYPFDGGEEDQDVQEAQAYGEVDVMIADTEHRRQGLGRAAVSAFLHYILQEKQQAILAEAASTTTTGRPARLRQLVAKIKAHNAPSISLFTSLGFQQRGDVNYFGEVELVHGLDNMGAAPDGYAERAYE